MRPPKPAVVAGAAATVRRGTPRTRSPRSWICALALASSLAIATAVACAEETPSVRTADEVMATVRSALGWYQAARSAMRSANDVVGGAALREDAHTLPSILQRVFDAARAEATLIEQSAPAAPPGAPSRSPRAERRSQLESSVHEQADELTRLQTRARTTPARRRAALESDISVLSNRLALDRLRLEFLKSLDQIDASVGDGDVGLTQQIQALQESVPELAATRTAPKTADVASAAPAAPVPPGTWSVVSRLLAFQRARNSLEHLTLATDKMARDVDRDLRATQDRQRSLARQLRAMVSPSGDAPAGRPVQNPAPSTLSAPDFRASLERLKLQGAVVLPLRAESTLLHRFATEIEGWQRLVEWESRRVLEGLAFQLGGGVIAVVVIFIGGYLWRQATMRYVHDPYHRRLLLTARTIAVLAAVALVLVFQFTSELTALVTALGFAAAGIAFALQNVILSVAGYFSMVAPNGIRIRDRVGLQGPFGFVNGEVMEIGFVRMRLRELAGDALEPTGRIVVFPNSVVFTGSFFKHPTAAAGAR